MKSSYRSPHTVGLPDIRNLINKVAGAVGSAPICIRVAAVEPQQTEELVQRWKIKRFKKVVASFATGKRALSSSSAPAIHRNKEASIDQSAKNKAGKFPVKSGKYLSHCSPNNGRRQKEGKTTGGAKQRQSPTMLMRSPADRSQRKLGFRKPICSAVSTTEECAVLCSSALMQHSSRVVLV